METHNLSDYDRSLIVGLTDAVNRLVGAMGSAETDRIYSCKEAAQFLGRSQQTISRYIAQGRIKKVVRGGIAGIPESELKKIKYNG